MPGTIKAYRHWKYLSRVIEDKTRIVRVIRDISYSRKGAAFGRVHRAEVRSNLVQLLGITETINAYCSSEPYCFFTTLVHKPGTHFEMVKLLLLTPNTTALTILIE